MKLYAIILSMYILTSVTRADVYDDIRTTLSDRVKDCSIKEVAIEFNVKYSTLYSFLKNKTTQSPTIEKAYNAWKVKFSPEKTSTQINESEERSSTDAVVQKLNFAFDVQEEASTVIVNLNQHFQTQLVTPLSTDSQDMLDKLAHTTTIITEPKKLNFSPKPLEQAPIHIPIRGSADEKDAKGTHFDHYVVQRATGHLSKAVVPAGTAYPSDALKSYTKQISYALPYGEGSRVLPVQATDDDGGLLIIPGRMRDRENDPQREQQERELLRKAFLRGQPVLGICAGSWRIWSVLCQLEYDATFRKTCDDGVIDVEDHAASRMMSVSNNTGNVVYNIELHGVDIEETSLLHSMMGKKAPTGLNVNSVHWKSPDKSKKPNNVNIVGIATEGTAKETKNRHGDIINSEVGAVEAFETVFGAPILGVQWHPEAYNPGGINGDYHLNILRWMAKAGDAYAQKRRILKQLSESEKFLSISKQ